MLNAKSLKEEEEEEEEEDKHILAAGAYLPPRTTHNLVSNRLRITDFAERKIAVKLWTPIWGKLKEFWGLNEGRVGPGCDPPAGDPSSVFSAQ